MSAAIVEAKDDATFAYYKGYIKDFDGKKVLLCYENNWKAEEFVDPRSVRQSFVADAHTFFPNVGDAVEALAKSHESEPFSWWNARVKTVKGDFYVISYADWGDAHNEVVEKAVLRPVNPNPHLEPADLVKESLSLPAELIDSEEDKKDVLAQRQKQQSYAELQQTSGVLSLIEDPSAKAVVLIGTKKAVATAKILVNMHIKHQQQLKMLQKKQAKTMQTLEEKKKTIAQNVVHEYAINPALLGLVIGKQGKNIKAAESVPGVLSIKVHSDTKTITIVAKDTESYENAKKLLDFVESKFPLRKSDIARFVGQKYVHLRDIEKASGVIRIRVPDSEPRPAGDRANGDKPRRPRRPDFNAEDTTIEFEIVGTRESVNNAMLLLQRRQKFLEEASQLEAGVEETAKKLRELEIQYGIPAGPRRKKEDAEQTNGDDTEKKTVEKKQRPKRERKPKAEANGEQNGDAAAAEKPAEANAAAAEDADKPKEKRARAPRNRGQQQEAKAAEETATA